MRLVVADPSFLLPALFCPLGHRRRLLTVFAYGALAFRARFLGEELELLEAEIRLGGAEAGGRPIDDLMADAAARKARLEEFLPAMTPDDLALVGSRHLFDELESKARGDYWRGREPAFEGDLGLFTRHQIVAITPIVVPDFDPFELPRYTTDRKDDYVIHTALAGDAFAVVSDDRRHIAQSADAPSVYEQRDSKRAVSAFQFMPFVEEHVNTSNFDLGDVDGLVLRVAHELLVAADQS
jgi:hypothetical protein